MCRNAIVNVGTRPNSFKLIIIKRISESRIKLIHWRPRVGLRGYYNKIIRSGEKAEWVLDMINSCCRWTMFRHAHVDPARCSTDGSFRFHFVANKLASLRCNTISILILFLTRYLNTHA